ncbi:MULTISPECIES: LLM class flavin-dependent oxidoreductase [unclassified Microbacterium]|uniref:LLM class flavin-dependent oxidoreductase n=1 Tax=unclassified Microbacterium TaxID=2609290 RepID=UPI00214AEB0F|nr:MULTISPECIES: LLM class flavin-dependent oxidoreductase [unclassified Microbacterium]MCR2784239.1 LLM class flavin-dependent oxidoreductase [Microbacterium sp. zg.B96]WIM14930.1 LLM class flavin-dependent oxidoreductase [Microbacterium sp. zg-B96]
MLSIGIAAAAGPGVAAELAPLLERAGFHGLWVNDTPGADALEVLAAAAAASENLVLATGVLPIDRRPAAEILREVDRLALPQHRLVLGIGSGQLRTGALDAVAGAARMLRAGTQARVVVGALGPRMRRLGATTADGLLLSWLTPAAAAEQARAAHAAAPDAHVALYVRTSLHPDADGPLAAETARYGGFPAYAANFARLGFAAEQTVIDSSADLREVVAAYRGGVDEVVLRAIVPAADPAAYREFTEQVARTLTP